MKHISVLAILWALAVVALIAAIAFCFYVVANYDACVMMTLM